MQCENSMILAEVIDGRKACAAAASLPFAVRPIDRRAPNQHMRSCLEKRIYFILLSVRTPRPPLGFRTVSCSCINRRRKFRCGSFYTRTAGRRASSFLYPFFFHGVIRGLNTTGWDDRNSLALSEPATFRKYENTPQEHRKKASLARPSAR